MIEPLRSAFALNPDQLQIDLIDDDEEDNEGAGDGPESGGDVDMAVGDDV